MPDPRPFRCRGGALLGGVLTAVLALAPATAHAGQGDHPEGPDGRVPSVESWGLNDGGQLGDGTTTERHTPVTVSGITAVTGLGTGSQALHGLAVLPNHTVKAWGHNFNGQVGDGTTVDHSTPGTVTDITTATQAAAGLSHSLALLKDGTAKAWGRNDFGQLGDGTTTDRTTPVTVSGLTNAVAIAAGGSHGLALLKDGTAKAWGRNDFGQLGDGTTTDRTTPVTVSGLTNAVAIAAGGSYNLALLKDGTVKAWGFNNSGQLGDGTTTNRTTPVTVSGLTNAVAIAAGGSHSLAATDGRRTTGPHTGSGLYTWGDNNFGQLGDGTTTNRSTPTLIATGLTAYTHLAAGLARSLAAGDGPDGTA
ncbi:RCC1 domain-containing protein [Streptomyces cellostaticus]|uniref:RCC1 domain-containing protein n=1 Tax=Streptomyces cellostaticus TaxID=67285 RepID=UPI003F92EE5A